MKADFYKYFLLTHQREKTLLERCETKMIKGAEFRYNHMFDLWMFFYGDNVVMSVEGCQVNNICNMMGNSITNIQAFKMLVGEWLVNCISRSEYSPYLQLLLTKMSECDRI